MKSVIKFASVFGCLALVLLASISVSAQFTRKPYADGELLVKYKDGTVSSSAARANSSIGALVLEEFPDLKWQRVKLPGDMSVEAAKAYYANQPNVEYAQPNFYYHLLATPNDPQFPTTGMWGLTKISAPSAWDLTTGSSSVVVADIDTGMRYTHQDLAPNAWINTGEVAGNNIDDDGNGFIDDVHGWDFFYNDSDPIDDAGGHGTHTAGTIGATGNNGLNVVGVNWNVKIMPIKIYSPNGTDSTSSMLVNAYGYIRMMKLRGVNIRATNNSYGDCGEACGYDQATKDALDAMGDAGIVSVYAAGNDNQNVDSFPSGGNPSPGYPARYTSPSVIAVASSTTTDARSSFSNYGVTSIDLAAPGSGVLSTYNSSNTATATLSGTSMATPHVTGAVALLSAYNPNLSVASLKATLMNTVDVLPAWNGLVKSGGRLNIDRALRNQTVCTFNLSTAQMSISTAGGNGSVNVTAPANCDYSIKSNAAWISVTSANVGSSNGTVNFTAQPFPFSDGQRTGTITIGDQTFTVTQGSPFITNHAFLDFDGDGRTDFSAIQNISGSMVWHNFNSSAGYSAISFGLFSDDTPVAGDYDGDFKTDVAVWRNSNGTFYVLQSSNNTARVFQFGLAGDNPNVSQDFDGDGKTDFAVTRAQGGSLIWYISGSTAGFSSVQFGNNTDRPVRGDYDGDSKADMAVFRAVDGTWWIRRSSNPTNFTTVQFGLSSDKVVPGDYDGDGKNDIAVWRPSDGVWHYLKSSNGAYTSFQFGLNGDLPTPGDYDGDGKTDFAVWRANQSQSESGVYYVQRSTAGFTAYGWGNSTMKITANSMQSQ
ncbi:MAG TPA: S8 family serine peptidase [Pyrinomonadaceae bacterium]|jgi:subtilisin family serine protease